MDVIRNSIHIAGVTPEDAFPEKINGQLIQYSDIETIFIPDEKPPAKSIFQVMIDIDIKSSRMIKTPLCRTMVIDGIKNYKIVYADTSGSDKANFLILKVPYNTFIDLSRENSEINKVEVYVMDAYFDLIDNRRIYSYTLYLVTAGLNHIDEVQKYGSTAYYPSPKDESLDSENTTAGTQPSKEDTLPKAADYEEHMREEADSQGSQGPFDGLVDMDSEYL